MPLTNPNFPRQSYDATKFVQSQASGGFSRRRPKRVPIYPSYVPEHFKLASAQLVPLIFCAVICARLGPLQRSPTTISLRTAATTHFPRDLHLAIACKPKIIRVHTFWGMFFLLWSNEISTSLFCCWIRVPILAQWMLLIRFSESRVFALV